jgi:hypothetical protein
MSAREALQLAEKLAEMGAEDGNIDSYMRQGLYNEYLREHGELEFGTSDFIATVPLVYMLTNGVELTVKAYLYAAHPTEAPSGPPKLPLLLERFHTEFAGDEAVSAVSAFVRAYTVESELPELLAKFLRANEMSLDELYSQRRFLNNTSFYSILERYQSFLYTWDEGKAFYQKVLADVRGVLALIDELQADIDSDGIAGEKVKALRKESGA